MTINEAYLFVSKVMNKEQVGYLQPSVFNLYAPIAQNEEIEILLSDLEAKKKNITSLLPLYKQNTIPKILPYFGGYTLPTDYLDYVNIFTLSHKQIDVLTGNQLPERMNSLVVPPTIESPVAHFVDKKVFIYPLTITENIVLLYVRKPIPPVFGFTMVNNRPVYNALTSQDFEIPDAVVSHSKICARILRYLGASLKDQETTAVSNSIPQTLPQ